jgi:hypothetical protein
MKDKRISKRRIEELNIRLCDRDRNILNSLQTCRYQTTKQIQRMYFNSNSSQTAALRATNRSLVKLQGFGLIAALNRRIGGVSGGSGAYVWSLTEAGFKLLRLNKADNAPRKRFFEPSPSFLEHTLAVSESCVQLTEICRKRRITLNKAELEPACWRSYTDDDGKPASLKPDMFAVTDNGDYEDNWFIEVDLATESPSVVLEKCKRYTRYYKSGSEQKQSGVFPLVVWIVPSLTRKDTLQRHIADSKEVRPKNIFLVITPDQFETLLSEGAEALKETRGDK